MKKTLLMVGALALTVCVAQAAEGDKKKPGDRAQADPAKRAEMLIKNADTDKNGSLSKEEFAASKMAEGLKKRGEDAADKFFARADGDKDDALSQEELAKHFSSAAGKGGKGAKKPADS